MECFDDLLKFDYCRRYLELINDLAAESEWEARFAIEEQLFTLNL